MRGTTPQWLYGALDEALISAGSTASATRRRAFVDRIVAAWNLEGRSFHNSRYLASVFENLDELEGATSEPENLKLAAALRGAQEEPGWEEAEEQRGPTTFPAMVSLDDLGALGIDEEVVARIADLVSQLACHSPRGSDLGARLLVDADLAAFATSPQKYRDFLASLRLEACHMPEEHFLALRLKVLKRLLGQPQIFSTPLASHWEDAARDNLEAELASIEAKLDRLGVRPEHGGEEGAQSPPSFPPSRGRLTRSGASEVSTDATVDQFEKSSYKRNNPKVLRISRSAKASRIQHPNEDVGPNTSITNPWEQEGTSADSLVESDTATHEGHRLVSDSSQFVSDTSTLESVADLIEDQRVKNPKKRK